MAPKQSLFQTKLDVPGIVQFFGGRVEMKRNLERLEIVSISTAAIDKWQSRGQIPASRLMDLETLARRLKKKFKVSEFVKKAA
jgi:hypothetical protein